MNIDLRLHSIADIVVDDYRIAAIFEKYGLDFCCKGNRTIFEAAREKDVDEDQVLSEIAALRSQASFNDANLQYWSLDFLAEYIVQSHHNYIRATTPSIKAHVTKIAEVHAEHHPELSRVRDLFLAVSDELTGHMADEEQVVFPYIAQMVKAESSDAAVPHASFGSVEKPIAELRQEHEAAGAAIEEIRRLTEHYTRPDDACTTYAATLEELAAYERDLHRHVHLENNILFPRAEKLEEKLRSMQSAASRF